MCTVSHILHLWCLKGRQTSAELTYFSHSSIFHRQPSSTRTKSHSGLRSFQVCAHSVSFSLGRRIVVPSWCGILLDHLFEIWTYPIWNILLKLICIWSVPIQNDISVSRITSTSQEPLEICKSNTKNWDHIGTYPHEACGFQGPQGNTRIIASTIFGWTKHQWKISWMLHSQDVLRRCFSLKIFKTGEPLCDNASWNFPSYGVSWHIDRPLSHLDSGRFLYCFKRP